MFMSFFVEVFLLLLICLYLFLPLRFKKKKKKKLTAADHSLVPQYLFLK